MKKVFLLCVGILALFLGLIGIVVPLMPTTPFLLLASYAFIRSSTKMNHWLLHHPVLGKYITNYIEHQAIPAPIKIFAIGSMWFSLLISTILIANPAATILILSIGIGVTIHILTLKTYRPGKEFNQTKEKNQDPAESNASRNNPPERKKKVRTRRVSEMV